MLLPTVENFEIRSPLSLLSFKEGRPSHLNLSSYMTSAISLNILVVLLYFSQWRLIASLDASPNCLSIFEMWSHHGFIWYEKYFHVQEVGVYFNKPDALIGFINYTCDMSLKSKPIIKDYTEVGLFLLD